MQGCTRLLETSVSSGGPGEGLEDSPKDWCITATDATARATLLTYATAKRQDSCRREDIKQNSRLMTVTIPYS